MAEKTVVTLEETLAALVEGKKYTTLRDILVTMNASDIAAIFEEMPEAKLPLLFRLLPKELAAETFVEMEPEAQELLIQGFSDHELKEVVDELSVDAAVDIVEEMPANVVKRILKQADPEMRKMINEILKYPDDSAGSIMTMYIAGMSGRWRSFTLFCSQSGSSAGRKNTVWKSSRSFWMELRATEISRAMPVDRGAVISTRIRVVLGAGRN